MNHVVVEVGIRTRIPPTLRIRPQRANRRRPTGAEGFLQRAIRDSALLGASSRRRGRLGTRDASGCRTFPSGHVRLCNTRHDRRDRRGHHRRTRDRGRSFQRCGIGRVSRCSLQIEDVDEHGEVVGCSVQNGDDNYFIIGGDFVSDDARARETRAEKIKIKRNKKNKKKNKTATNLHHLHTPPSVYSPSTAAPKQDACALSVV